jgi:hypothetical protein
MEYSLLLRGGACLPTVSSFGHIVFSKVFSRECKVYEGPTYYLTTKMPILEHKSKEYQPCNKYNKNR